MIAWKEVRFIRWLVLSRVIGRTAGQSRKYSPPPSALSRL